MTANTDSASTPTTGRQEIVVGHDGSEGSTHALEFALTMAEKLDAAVCVVRSWSLDAHLSAVAQILGRSRSDEEISASLREELVSESSPLVQKHPDVSVDYEVEPGEAADVLAYRAESGRMLVVGTRGRGGFRGLALGSVSIQCLQRGRGPVLCVPSGEHLSRLLEHAAALEDFPKVRPVPEGSIVVGHDGSVEADGALAEAVRLADELSAPLTVVRVWSIETAPHGALWVDGAVASHEEISQQICAILESHVASFVAAHPSVQIDYRAVLGHPAEVLTRLSRDALMLVLGRRGRGRLRGLVLGSVSTQCLHLMMCPALVVSRHP